MSTKSLEILRHASVAILAVALATVLRLALSPVLGERVPFVTYFVAVVFAAWYGGLSASIWATILSSFFAALLFIPPQGIRIEGAVGWTSLAAFLFVGLACAYLSNLMRVAQKRSEAEADVATRQQEELQTTLTSIGDGVITTDARGNVEFLNGVAEQLTGWTLQDAAGRPVQEIFRIINEETRQPAENPVEVALREGRTVGLANHTVLIAKDGSECPIDDSAAPIRDKDGEILGCVLVFRDVRDRRLAEQRLRVREERYRALVTATAQMVWTTDPEGRVVDDSPSWRKFTGQSLEEWQGTGWLDAIHPEDRDRARQAWFDSVTARIGYETEYRLRASDGTYRWTAARAVPVLESDGSIREWVGTNTDITDQRRAEDAVRESEEKFRLMADTIPQLAWMARPDGYIFWYNQRWYEYTGTTPAEMEGWGWRTIHDPDVLPSVIEQWQKSIDEGVPLDMVFPLRAADGTYRSFLTRVNPLRDRNGRIVYWFGTNTDISEQKEVQEELRDILARLSEADRRKDTFLATLAHELRNPLAPIRSGLEIMKLAKDSPDTIEEVRGTMERQTQQLITLVDDLLDISRITRDKLDLRRCRVQLDEIVRSAVEASRQSIDDARHTLTLALPAEPIELEADPHRLAQVISNLLNNAAKYTPEGGTIHLAAELHRDQVVVSVKDSGIGIPAEMKDRIFEMFTQIDHPLEKGSTGLGIGLTLVKSLVEMHGGGIEVHSDGENRGSDFRVYLPLAPRPAPKVTTASDSDANEKPQSKCRVLVVDDNKAAADMLSMVVQMLGNEVRTAHDGQQAVEMAADYLPEVVLMDIGMPKMNGYEAARLIRQQPWGQGMMLVALTGWGQDEDKRRTKEAGFDRHLTKPAEPADLQQLFATFSRHT